MAVAKITKRSVESIPVGVKDTYVWDSDLSGFGVKVTPAGRRVYLAQYRTRTGQTKKITLGTHGVLTADQARDAAKSVLATATLGSDPAADRAAEKAQPIFKDVMADFLTKHVEANRKKSTAKEYRRLLTVHIPASWNSRPVVDITTADVTALHVKLKSTPREANHLVAVLSSLFTWCEKQEIRSQRTNPCYAVPRFKENKRDRYLLKDEGPRLGEAMRDALANKNQFAATAMLLLAYTAARRSEILTLKWSYVDLDKMLLNLPDSKKGHKFIALNGFCVERLKALPKVEGNPYVIAGRNGEHMSESGLFKVWKDIRKTAKLDDFRGHDLRHTFASLMVNNGYSLYAAQNVLGHSDPKTTQRYSHMSPDFQQAASEATAAKLSNLLNLTFQK